MELILIKVTAHGAPLKRMKSDNEGRRKASNMGGKKALDMRVPEVTTGQKTEDQQDQDDQMGTK